LALPIGLAFNRDMKVTKVTPNGQGEQGGIPVGSIVLAVAGTPVKNVVDFQLEMRRCSFNGDEFCEVDFQIKERKFCKVKNVHVFHDDANGVSIFSDHCIQVHT